MTTVARPVSPAEIQNELNRIWESLETTNVARACLFNLIFYTQKNHRTAYFQRVAQNVIEKFPSRVLFLTIDRDSKEDYIKTEVSILSSSKGEFDIACDYIQVATGGASNATIPFLVLPHILPDLPVYLILAEDPSKDDPLCYQLEQFANRLIVDSEATDNLPRFAKGILAHYEKSQFDIADLNWARIESWREMLSNAFHSREKLEKIQQAKQIKITYNSQATPFFCHTQIQAIYLQAWLACQLDWKFEDLRKNKESFSFHYTGKNGPIEIAVTAVQHTTLPPGLILSIDLLSSNEESFTFVRDNQLLHQITYQHSTPDHCDLPSHYIFTKAESGHSLVKEICHKGTSEHFLKVLNLLKDMEALALC